MDNFTPSPSADKSETGTMGSSDFLYRIEFTCVPSTSMIAHHRGRCKISLGHQMHHSFSSRHPYTYLIICTIDGFSMHTQDHLIRQPSSIQAKKCYFHPSSCSSRIRTVISLLRIYISQAGFKPAGSSDGKAPVCKARERIHRGVSDPRLLAIPAS